MAQLTEAQQKAWAGFKPGAPHFQRTSQVRG